MTPVEVIIAAGLLALLAVTGRYLFSRNVELVPGNGTIQTGSPFENGSAPFKAGPEGHPLPQWGALDALATAAVVFFGVTAVGVVAILLASLVAAVVAPGSDILELLDNPTGNAFFLVLQWAVMVGLPLLYLHARGYLFDRVTFGFRRTNPWYALGIWLAVMLACYIFLPTAYSSLIERYELFELPEQDIVDPFGLTWGGFIITLIAVTIVTPVVEEFFFRGIIHQGLEKQLGFFVGAIISSSIFALAHYPFWELMPILFFIGFGFAVMLRATGSLWPPIAGHFVVNFTAVIINYSELY
jgi:hypothetical protein